jgi:AcrR family transcriptional regulator
MSLPEVEVSRRTRKKDETKARIFKAAVRLFREKGFEETTVDEITERADVAKGTFFNYFPRKESVLGYLSENQLAEAEEHAGAIFGANKPVREKLIELLQRIASVYEEEPELSRYVVQESMRRAYTPTDAAHTHWHNLLARLVREGQESNEFRRDVDPTRAIYVLGSVYMGTVFMWLCSQAAAPGREGKAYQLQDELRDRLALVLDGLAS